MSYTRFLDWCDVTSLVSDTDQPGAREKVFIKTPISCPLCIRNTDHHVYLINIVRCSIPEMTKVPDVLVAHPSPVETSRLGPWSFS